MRESTMLILQLTTPENSTNWQNTVLYIKIKLEMINVGWLRFSFESHVADYEIHNFSQPWGPSCVLGIFRQPWTSRSA
jgi:hypothetical protein